MKHTPERIHFVIPDRTRAAVRGDRIAPPSSATGLVRCFDNLNDVEADAGNRLDRSAQAWNFDRLDWFKLVEKYTLTGSMAVLKASHQGNSGWLFLDRNRHFAKVMTNWLCLRTGTVFSGDGSRQLLTNSLVDQLRKTNVHHIYLDPVGAEHELVRSLKRRGWATKLSKVNVSWQTHTHGMSFEDYWADRPSKLRNTAARRARKAKLDFAFFSRFHEAAWADFESVFAASWKLPEGTPELTRDFAEIEGSAGTLRLGIAYKDGQAVAAQLWTIEDSVATIHKLAYREDAKKLSPGTVLSVEMFRRALDNDGVDMIDFGFGNDSYKSDWMTHHVPLYAITAYDMLHPAGIFGFFKAVVRRIGQKLRLIHNNEKSHGRPRTTA